MDTIAAIHQRLSVTKFDPAGTISEAEVRALIELAVQAPSSMDIQHWRFVAVTSPADKARLKAVAHDQQKVVDAAVTFIVLGDLRGYERLATALEPLVTAGTFSRELADRWVQTSRNLYGSNPQMARDEAIRSGSLAAMVLMLAAESQAFASGPMIGFDPDAVRREFHIPERYVPVMLLPVGRVAAGNWPRKPRFATDDILFSGDGRKLPA